jgi:hypothetical protein
MGIMQNKYKEKDGDIVEWASAEERARFLEANERELTLAKPLYDKLLGGEYTPNNNYQWQRENGADGVMAVEEGEYLVETKMTPFKTWRGEIWLEVKHTKRKPWFEKAFDQPTPAICFMSFGSIDQQHFILCHYKDLQQRYRDTEGWELTGVDVSWESTLINVPYHLIQDFSARGTYNKSSGVITFIKPEEPRESALVT